MARRRSLRASDSDRDDVVERLRAAAAEGRLLVAELEERLEVALHARTYGELDALLVDLPAAPAPAPLPVARRRPGLPLVAGAILTIGVLLTALEAAANTGLARLDAAAGNGAAPNFHGHPDAFFHPGPANLLAAIAPLVMIVLLVTICCALGGRLSRA